MSFWDFLRARPSFVFARPWEPQYVGGGRSKKPTVLHVFK